jgi:LysR family glycine cleavage system transcriptional activator
VRLAIPPLNPLRVFEVVARLGSFTKAAEELHVSQSAVSRQVSIIESYLGVKLLNREQRGVTLTETGRIYQRQISQAFAQISAATQDLLASSRSGPIKLRVYNTFAANWLIRRLQDFRAIHPELEVELCTTVTPVDFDKENIDLAIQFGDGSWPGVKCHRLFDDEIAPVCSPALLKRKAPLDAPEDLAHFCLLHSQYRKNDWLDWLTAVGLPQLANRPDSSMLFPNSILAYQAAMDGLGVAMGQIRLLDQQLEDGSLVCPFPGIVRHQYGYHLLMPQSDSVSRKVTLFRDWLLKEVAQSAHLRTTSIAARF